MSQIDRVMYLYHYFIPLHFALILFSLVVLHLFRAGLERGSRKVYGALFLLLFWLGHNFVHFSALTYFKPLTKAQFEVRVKSNYWGLVPIR